MTRRHSTKALAALALAAATAVWLHGAPPAAAQGPRPNQLVGLTAPSRIAAIGAESAGTIVAMPVTEGTRVAAGDLLFQLSSRLQQLEVDRLQALLQSDLEQERAKASVRHAKERLERHRELSAKEIASRSAVEDAELSAQLAELSLGAADLEREQLKNQLAQARERLLQRTLVSPFDGVVTKRIKQAGETVDQLLPVVEVMSLDPLWIEFECPIAEERHHRIGSRVQVKPAVGEHEPRMAEVVYVSWKATPASHTVLVRAAVRNEDYGWRAGLKVVVTRAPGSVPANEAAAPPAAK